MDIQILGRESILITGREGSGKSHFLMQNIYAILLCFLVYVKQSLTDMSKISPC